MSDSYSVDVGQLRHVVGNLNGQADHAQRLRSGARDTAVPGGAWGQVGEEFGLDATYEQVRAEAEQTLGAIGRFLTWAATNLAETAGRYEEHEEATATLFRHIAEPPEGPR